MRNTLALGALCLFLLLTGGCTTNPATGSMQLNAISTSQEVSMGNEAAPQFLASYGGEVPASDVNQYVDSIGRQLVSVCERKDLPWEFHLVDSQVINAFALPGGKVFFSRGLAEKLTNEAQLAGILGHEVGHVTAQHIGQQMTRAIGLQAVVAAIGIASQTSERNGQLLGALGLGAQGLGSVYLLKFGRDQESQADALGMRYMSRVGYNPAAQLQVMQVLAQASGSGGRSPEFLSTHPYPETRIARIKQLLATEYKDWNQQGKYRFAEQQFQQRMLVRLAQLPPPRHTGQEQARLDSPSGDALVLNPVAWCSSCQRAAFEAQQQVGLHD